MPPSAAAGARRQALRAAAANPGKRTKPPSEPPADRPSALGERTKPPSEPPADRPSALGERTKPPSEPPADRPSALGERTKQGCIARCAAAASRVSSRARGTRVWGRLKGS